MEMTTEKNMMVPLSKYVKYEESIPKNMILPDLNDKPLLSQLETILERPILPINIDDDLYTAEVQFQVEGELKANQLLILTNSNQSYWGLGNFILCKK